MDTSVNLAGELVERRLLSADEMERVNKLQQEQQTPFTRLLVELGFLSEDDLLPVLRDHYGIPLISLREPAAAPLALTFYPGVAEFFRIARMVPVKIEGQELIVAMTDPFDLPRLHALELAAGLRVKPVLAKEKEILARIETLYGNGYSSDAAQGRMGREIEGAVDEEDVAHLRDMAS